MAEAAVGSLLLKIGYALAIPLVKSTYSILTTEAWSMKKFFGEMKDIQEELLSIRGYLHEAEKFSEMDDNIKNFIREIRRVAFDIEDIVDEFTYKLEEQKRGIITKTIKRIVHVRSWYQLTKMLKKIEVQIKDIQERKKRYDTSHIVKRQEINDGRWRTAEDQFFVDEDDLVGIDDNKGKLIEMLSDNKRKHNVITVWGMGGVGKTTLVTNIYNTVKKNFDASAWVTVSQSWKKDKLLRKLLRELHRDPQTGISIDGIDNMDTRSVAEKIQNYLHQKRYLIVLDDVWDPNVWHCIADKLPQGTFAHIILTTRIREVALLAPKQQIIRVNPLDQHHSRDLFCKTAFSKNDTSDCPLELDPWVDQIVEKCDGLPLAIVVIGGLMACKEQTIREWKKMWDDLEKVVANDGNLKGILHLSFADLSCNIKNCLLYWSVFPEDWEINVVSLQNLWIAEGFLETHEYRTEEEITQDCLDELVSRCLLQVAGLDIYGRVEYRMHDIIHSMVVSKSKDEEFSMTLRSSDNIPGDKARRVSIQHCYFKSARENEFSFRSLLAINSEISLESLRIMLTTSRFLRVLDLEGTPMERLPKEVFRLFNLHLLGLNYTGLIELPTSIGRLQNLQFLWAAGTKILELPNEISKLRRLKELWVTDNNFISTDGDIFKGVRPPKQIWQLKELRVLRYIKATHEIVKNLKYLKELTQLSISDITSEHCEALFTATSNMSHLERLTVAAKDGENLNLQALDTSAKIIYISGQIEKTSVPRFFMSLQRHNSIRLLVLLKGAKIDESSFSCLQEIRSLTTLELHSSYYGNEMCFHETSFPSLQELKLMSAPHLQHIAINEGAMPNLETLIIGTCPEQKELPQGIEYLTKLQNFEWYSPNRTLVERVEREWAEAELSEDRKGILSLVQFYPLETLGDN